MSENEQTVIRCLICDIEWILETDVSGCRWPDNHPWIITSDDDSGTLQEMLDSLTTMSEIPDSLEGFEE